MSTDGLHTVAGGTSAKERSIESRLSSLFADERAAEGLIWLVDNATDSAAIARATDARLTAMGGVTMAGDWRAGFHRPFGPLADALEDAAAYL